MYFSPVNDFIRREMIYGNTFLKCLFVCLFVLNKYEYHRVLVWCFSTTEMRLYISEIEGCI